MNDTSAELAARITADLKPRVDAKLLAAGNLLAARVLANMTTAFSNVPKAGRGRGRPGGLAHNVQVELHELHCRVSVPFPARFVEKGHKFGGFIKGEGWVAARPFFYKAVSESLSEIDAIMEAE